MITIRMGYTKESASLEALAKSAEWCIQQLKALENEGLDFDTIAVTGMSGILVGPRVAEALGKALFIVRKEGDSNHGFNKAIGQLGRRLVFLDDFIENGGTLARVIKTIDAVLDKAGDKRYQWDRAWQLNAGRRLGRMKAADAPPIPTQVRLVGALLYGTQSHYKPPTWLTQERAVQSGLGGGYLAREAWLKSKWVLIGSEEFLAKLKQGAIVEAAETGDYDYDYDYYDD